MYKDGDTEMPLLAFNEISTYEHFMKKGKVNIAQGLHTHAMHSLSFCHWLLHRNLFKAMFKIAWTQIIL